MRVAMYYNNKDVRLEEVEKPKVGPDEVLIKIIASGICGSDIMEWYRIKKAPLVLGHEISGEIAEVGENVTQYKPGQRVSATHHVSCDECSYCLDGNETDCDMIRNTKFYPGGFAEYVRIPKINVEKGFFVLPDNVSYDEGTFIEPLGCVIRGQKKANVKGNHTVLVLGSGLSGLLHIQLAKSKGAKVIATDVDRFKLDMAKKLGADYVFDAREDIPEKVKEVNGKLADRVIVCASAPPAVKQAMESVDRGGTILVFALFEPGTDLNLPLPHLMSRGVTITTSYAAVKRDLQEATELLKNKKINVTDMITHRVSLGETVKGFEMMTNPQNSIKIIVEPHK
ncbi:MAG: alcohol dehydrogenase catalytic domain-containing protein [Candidatus Aenigmatarchaeota archaeon]|nr:alcohol dehydrogenase catalytic domain-containing protein [Nanoarchaeota archaeon]